jgi:GxxExxY protein
MTMMGACGTSAARCRRMPRTLTAAELNRITDLTIGGSIRVHRTYGSGLLERAYRDCVCEELRLAGLSFELEKPIPVTYRGVTVARGFRADIVVEREVVLEVKAIAAVAPIHRQQMLTYLRLADCPVGLILNFGKETMLAGIERVVNRFPET